MRSLCTCAAFAVVTAFAHGHFADALLRASRDEDEGTTISNKQLNEHVDDCLTKINEFRQELVPDAELYEEDADVKGELQTKSEEDLETFLADKNCEVLESGNFNHMSTTSGDSTQIFVITAKKASAYSARGTDVCEPALEQWKTGFSAFEGKHPPVYKDYSSEKSDANPYAEPNAAALASLLQKGPETLVCGKLQDCANVEVLCYFKPSKITTSAVPVDAKLWHALEAQEKLKPTLDKKDEGEDETDILKAVNDARTAIGLNSFTSPEFPEAMKRVKRSARSEADIQDAIKEFLYTLTCDNIIQSNIDSSPSEKDFTVIYHIKDGADPPTMEEAVAHWQTGFDKLEYKRPPAFKKATTEEQTESDTTDPAVEASKIYNDSAVAGYVSIMTDDARTMACVVATGCEVPQAETLRSGADETTSTKSGLICLVHKATLKDDEEPISEATWAKIMEQKGHPLPKFEKLAEDKNCLEEMNAVRTQEKLGLKAFVASQEAKTSTDLALSSLMKNVTCPAIGGAATTKTETSKGPEFQITDGTTSLMYHSVADVSCSAAVEAWKKGFEKFTTAPPAYKPDETVYQDAAATNFVSLITDKDATITATCYSTGCATAGIVCELSPAALEKDKKPVSEETWTKYSEIGGETSGVAGVSKAALIGTVMMTLAAGVFFL